MTMRVLSFQEAKPTPLTHRLSELLGGELDRAGISRSSATETTNRILLTIRASLVSGGPTTIPGFGRFLTPVPVTTGSGDPTGISFSRLLPDPYLGGRWPSSLLDYKEFFEGRWTALAYPRTLGRPGEGLPGGIPLRHMPTPRVDELLGRKLAEALPLWLSMTTPEEASDSFNLRWLSRIGSQVSALAGRIYVVGSQRYERALFFGIYEHGEQVSLFREEIPGLLGRATVPQLGLPPVPRDFYPVLESYSASIENPNHLARRMVLALSAGEIDLDAVTSLWYSILDGHFLGMQQVPPPVALLQSILLALAIDGGLETLWTAVERAFGRLAREIANLPLASACLDLSPLGVLFRIDEPEGQLSLARGPGRVTLLHKATWLLAWGGSSGW